MRFAIRQFLVAAAFALSGVTLNAAEKPPLPPITKPVLFNTPEADRILAAMQVFPPDNPWNTDISQTPLLSNSREMIEEIGANAHIAYNLDMNFVIVPPDQLLVGIDVLQHKTQSDKGPFPIPENAPVEGWPLLDKRSLEESQTGQENKDRHVIVVDPVNGKLYELYQGRKTPNGWTCASGAMFDLKTNKLRPNGWTSADAAGLPIFPAVVRYDEVERGMVEHAMRFTVKRTRYAFVHPATHYAAPRNRTDPKFPRMGERFRLRADYDISNFSPHVQAILKGLKKYGMFVADNGGDWRISIAPDDRIKGLDELRRLKGSDFEVVDADQGATEREAEAARARARARAPSKPPSSPPTPVPPAGSEQK